MPRRFLLLLHILVATIIKAQPSKMKFIEDADEHFRHNNFVSAIPIYKSERKYDPQNLHVKYYLALCYLNTRLNRALALNLLEEVSKNPKADDEVWLNLGHAYRLLNRPE